ncbi:hypothetical protein GCM10009608_69250 [Pseudonocardia alaniniphila]
MRWSGDSVRRSSKPVAPVSGTVAVPPPGDASFAMQKHSFVRRGGWLEAVVWAYRTPA